MSAYIDYFIVLHFFFSPPFYGSDFYVKVISICIYYSAFLQVLVACVSGLKRFFCLILFQTSGVYFWLLQSIVIFQFLSYAMLGTFQFCVASHMMKMYHTLPSVAINAVYINDTVFSVWFREIVFSDKTLNSETNLICGNG